MKTYAGSNADPELARRAETVRGASALYAE
jgi:hypothetical protein